MVLRHSISFILGIFMLIPIVSCSSQKSDNKIVISGTIKGATADEVLAVSNFNGEVSFKEQYEIQIDSVGNFSIEIDMPVEAGQLTIINAAYKNLDFYVKKGETVNVDIDYTPAIPEVKFSGSLADINRAFYTLDSIQMNRKEQTYEEYLTNLKSDYEKYVEPRNAAVKDKRLREYVTKLNRLKLEGRIFNTYDGKCRQENTNPDSIPEYVSIKENWNPNDPIMIDAGLIVEYVESRCKNPYTHREVSPIDFERLDIIERDITNPDCRRVALSFYGNMFFVNKMPNGKEATEYYERFMPLTEGCAPEVAERAKKDYETIMANVPGKPLNYDPTIESPDGKKQKLSEIIDKVTYIDVWATWCGPCCAEIPHLEKVIARHEGNNDLKFASLSVDSDREAWLAKLEKDKPDWPQYRILDEDKDKFMDAHGINGIPRFFLMSADGTFYSSNAPRPSDPKIDSTIAESLNN